ncbi:bifunctional riboflavin kinase/FAD synthetase [Syntrophaceticus schinkii]|jgi:riboflavin kinase/FMN adenylyltransferase|uniref:Riboflavin biosynthesis protein n=1 Tax=Syntrophaceticus schinkii TaxID=499207 RepID=A0A0B7MBA4_9FIRM|nr:bifunctional riboflavin kinase/FAD synthetase [Syntrophaceticus schinkii]CEO87335.1 Riboflavin kinase / FMN adenylyltransferase [Syntrophaceticus schinkii]
MVIFGGMEKMPVQERQLVVALGNFDGVHRGHQQLLRQMTAYAQKNNALAAVILFQPHPQQVLNPSKCPKLLLDTDKKIELLEKQGVQGIFIVPFDIDFASLAPEEFIDKILVGKLQVTGVFVGYDYRFGRTAEGTPELLRELGKQKGFYVEVVPPVLSMETPISSTLVRKALSTGDIRWAKELLGYWPVLRGKIMTGDQRGRKLGFPTANIHVSDELLVPQNGVYAGEALIQGKHYLTVTNIGVHPTFGSSRQELIEAHLLDFQGDIYHEDIEISLFERMRDERKFESPDLLIKQIRKDIEIAIKIYDDHENNSIKRDVQA